MKRYECGYNFLKQCSECKKELLEERVWYPLEKEDENFIGSHNDEELICEKCFLKAMELIDTVYLDDRCFNKDCKNKFPFHIFEDFVEKSNRYNLCSECFETYKMTRKNKMLEAINDVVED